MHQEECRTAAREGQAIPQTPSPDVIGNAATLLKHVSIGKKAMKWTEEETVELRKMLYGGDTLFGSYTIWATLSPDDLKDAQAAAYAGFTFGDDASLRNPFRESSSSPTGYSADGLAEAIANNLVACARAFRKQLEIYIKDILGWDLKTGTSKACAIGLVQAFSLQVSSSKGPVFTNAKMYAPTDSRSAIPIIFRVLCPYLGVVSIKYHKINNPKYKMKNLKSFVQNPKSVYYLKHTY
jgi:hypothetical protein